MADYTFRLRIDIPKSASINICEPTSEISGLFDFPIKMSTGHPEIKISESQRLIFRASGFGTEEDAVNQGKLFGDVLMIAFAGLHIGADFGARSPKGGFTKYGLGKFEESAGRKLLNDVHGLMVFETELASGFIFSTPPTITIGKNRTKFVEALSNATKGTFPLSARERLAFDIFSSSYFEQSEDARFLTLMMALEVLFTQTPRPTESIALVNNFIEATRESVSLSESERESIVGSLSWLLNESISQSGRRFVTERLGDREYMDMRCDKFFIYCYGIRSNLIHGNEPFPPRSEVSQSAAILEGLAADIIAAEAMSNAP